MDAAGSTQVTLSGPLTPKSACPLFPARRVYVEKKHDYMAQNSKELWSGERIWSGTPKDYGAGLQRATERGSKGSKERGCILRAVERGSKGNRASCRFAAGVWRWSRFCVSPVSFRKALCVVLQGGGVWSMPSANGAERSGAKRSVVEPRLPRACGTHRSRSKTTQMAWRNDTGLEQNDASAKRRPQNDTKLEPSDFLLPGG